MHNWLQSQGRIARVGVEGTGSYGAGLTRHLTKIGVEVVEVNRPNRQLRRRLGKTDRHRRPRSGTGCSQRTGHLV